jgi:hypothetical protein
MSVLEASTGKLKCSLDFFVIPAAMDILTAYLKLKIRQELTIAALYKTNDVRIL